MEIFTPFESGKFSNLKFTTRRSVTVYKSRFLIKNGNQLTALCYPIIPHKHTHKIFCWGWKQIFHKYLATPAYTLIATLSDFSCLVYCFVLLIKCNKIITLVARYPSYSARKIYLELFIHFSHNHFHMNILWTSSQDELPNDWISNRD